MIILLFAVVLAFVLNFKSAVVYFAIATAATFIMAWMSAYSSNGIASDGSNEDKNEAFKLLLTGAVFGRPWLPIDLLAIGSSIAYYFYNK